MTELHERILDWYTHAARDLPWRRPGASAWGVMVSEFMLQQTPVARVLPRWLEWLDRWPTPADLAAEPSGEAVRAWGRLGYPRRALRLHAAASMIVDQHGGQVPSQYADLIALPGVGDYTASAIASFAFGHRHIVLDTNVRRVFARAASGEQYPANSVSKDERALAASLMPADDLAARWAAATMELGALVCTAASPDCAGCPVTDLCRWRADGYPAYDGPARRGQAWHGTDRQVRGKLLSVVRDAHPEPVPKAFLDAVWPDPSQRERCLDSLLDDRLVDVAADGTFSLTR